MNSPFLPGPYSVLTAFFRISTAGDIDGYTLSSHAMTSIYRVLLGFLFAGMTAIPLGIFMGLKPSVNSVSSPIIEPIRFIPPIAWIPLAIILLGGITRYVFLIWIGAFFPILLNTIAGVKRTSAVLVDMAKTFGADSRTITFKIVFPSALPEVMSGLRVGLGVGWMCIVAAEMIGGDPVGLGRLIIKYANLYQMDVVILGMVTIGIIGLILNYAILSTERRLFKWRVEVRA
ncbi:MAG: ABC transporter permease [Candidatus Verstraetearchaeota archaeon]|nr:ABC transporter permease [Candidatus Verstraetearchaeota archaeon]